MALSHKGNINLNAAFQKRRSYILSNSVVGAEDNSNAPISTSPVSRRSSESISESPSGSSTQVLEQQSRDSSSIFDINAREAKPHKRKPSLPSHISRIASHFVSSSSGSDAKQGEASSVSSSDDDGKRRPYSDDDISTHDFKLSDADAHDSQTSDYAGSSALEVAAYTHLQEWVRNAELGHSVLAKTTLAQQESSSFIINFDQICGVFCCCCCRRGRRGNHAQLKLAIAGSIGVAPVGTVARMLASHHVLIL